MLSYNIKNNFDNLTKHGDVWYWENLIDKPEWLLETIEKEPYFGWQSLIKPNGQSMGYEKRINSQGAAGTDGINEEAFYILQCFNTIKFNAANTYLSNKNLKSKEYEFFLNHIVVRKWDKEIPMSPHGDNHFINGENVVPDFQFIYYLTDNLDGGEIYFPDIDLNIRPANNSAIIFPGNMLHGVKPFTNGSRITMSRPIIKKEKVPSPPNSIN
jgi:hypothetical protein